MRSRREARVCSLWPLSDRRSITGSSTDVADLSWIPTRQLHRDQAAQSEGLRKKLEGFWALRRPTGRERRRIIRAVSTIVGQTIRRHWMVRVLGRMAIVVTAVFYVLVVFLAQYTSWGGASSLYEQHAFLLPVPFFSM